MAKVIAVAGGCGFVGQHLCEDLLARNYKLVLIDVAPLPSSLADHPNLSYRKVDLTDKTTIDKVFEEFSPETVINISGWGMSGADMLSKKCFQVNVQGTHNLIEACKDHDIEFFIHTSTYNVVFHGKPIVNGDESIPYPPDDQHLDCYSHSKSISEQYVLSQNGQACKSSGKLLKTSCIRPAAIYGEGEMRHIPRILRHIDSNAFLFTIGDATVDWVHVENLSLAYVLLMEKMWKVTSAEMRPCNAAYCISDGSPVQNFAFLRPLCLARGQAFPSWQLPVGLLMVVSGTMEWVYALCPALSPLLTRAEVAKVGVTHYFTIANAAKDFGYKPKFDSQIGSERLARYYASFPNDHFFRLAAWWWYGSIATGMTLLYIVAYLLRDQAAGDARSDALRANVVIAGAEWLGLLVFRSRVHLQLVFLLACLTHLAEACIALYLARYHFPQQQLLWFIQTLMLGFPSLSLIFERIKNSKPNHNHNKPSNQKANQCKSKTDTDGAIAINTNAMQ